MLAQRDVFGETLADLCLRDERVVVLDGDLANSTKSDRVATTSPERFFMVGIAEQNLVGIAAGLATVGFVPWVASFAAFLATRDLDQIRVVVAQPRLNVKLAAHYSGLLTGYTGKTHQVVNDIAIMRSMPNMTVIAPADGIETKHAMVATNAYDGPVYLRLTRDAMRCVIPDEPFTIGKARLLREGTDLTIISTGAQTVRAYEAAEILAAEGIFAHLLHVPTIKPFDEAAILAAASRTGVVLVCEEHSILGGLGGAVAELLGSQLPTLVERLGLTDVDAESGPNDALLEKYGLSTPHIVRRAKHLARGA